MTISAKAHEYLAHEIKTSMLQCPCCDMQELIVEDLLKHMRTYHDVDMSAERAKHTLLKGNIPTFLRLFYCQKCGLRNASYLISNEHAHLTRPRARSPTTSETSSSSSDGGAATSPDVIVEAEEVTTSLMPLEVAAAASVPHVRKTKTKTTTSDTTLASSIDRLMICQVQCDLSRELDFRRRKASNGAQCASQYVSFVFTYVGDVVPVGDISFPGRYRIYIERTLQPGEYEVVNDADEKVGHIMVWQDRNSISHAVFENRPVARCDMNGDAQYTSMLMNVTRHPAIVEFEIFYNKFTRSAPLTLKYVRDGQNYGRVAVAKMKAKWSAI